MGDLVYTDLLLSIIKRLERTLSEKGIKIDERLLGSLIAAQVQADRQKLDKKRGKS